MARRRKYWTASGYYWATPAEQRRRPKSKRGRRVTLTKRERKWSRKIGVSTRRRKKKWIQKAHLKKGALHRMMGIPSRDKISSADLLFEQRRAFTVLARGTWRSTGHTKAWWQKYRQRLQTAINLRKRKRSRRR